MWAGAAAALAISGLVWLAWPAAPAPGRTAATAQRGVQAPSAERDGARVTHMASRSARLIEVAVTACKRRAGAGVEVIAERGGYTYTARAGADGLARVDVEEAGEVTVRARIGAYRTAPWPVNGSSAAIEACPGARIHGTVRDGHGIPEIERTVRLVDAAGGIIDEIESDDDGAYEVVDGMLEGVSLVVVTDGMDDAEDATRALRPLSPREDRELDLIVGDVRAVVGWVLDMNGDPQPGVVVTATAEAFEARWVAFTDQGGGFVFEAVPAASLQIAADGGDLGQAAARVAESEAERREVSLVLEPTAHITVLAPNVAGTVEIRCWDGRFHGPDQLTEPAETSPFEADFVHDADIVWDDNGTGFDADLVVESSFPEPDHMMKVLEDALRAYDPTDPEGSLVHMIQRMLTEMPEMQGAFAAENGELPVDPAAQEAFLREMVAEELRNNPEQFEMFGRMAAEVQSGKSLMEASQAAYGGWEGSVEMNEPEDVQAAPVEVQAGTDGWERREVHREPQVLTEVAVDEGGVEVWDTDDEAIQGALSAGDADLPYDLDAVGDGSADELGLLVGEDFDGVAPNGAVTGFDLYAPLPRRARAATGPIGAQIAVRASFHYDVVLITPEGDETYVGRVFVNPGDDVIIPVGGTDPVAITGRVVDVRGEPVAGVEVSTWMNPEGDVMASSAPDGTFRLEAKPGQPTPSMFFFNDPAGRYEATSRRNVTVVSGAGRDLGAVVVRSAEEEPPGQMYEPYGGIGGLVSIDDLGVRLDDVEPSSPLALSGIETGDTIVTIDDAAAAELPMSELLLRLRGEAGTTVNLRVRTAAGELYDVGVLRDTIQPRSAWEPVLNEDQPQIYFE
ncbi:MAG: hypothetical protein CVU56_20090 [Deltaproteobacteria bacterium HGW-Deltaproteobacteria-14]|jgi:hypothetical protein|nr:MAG: hypothetical protein CVU56_20090 [Deltaproteobacteria bacterium HGW-Deltaproteobacteria-14]